MRCGSAFRPQSEVIWEVQGRWEGTSNNNTNHNMGGGKGKGREGEVTLHRSTRSKTTSLWRGGGHWRHQREVKEKALRGPREGEGGHRRQASWTLSNSLSFRATSIASACAARPKRDQRDGSGVRQGVHHHLFGAAPPPDNLQSATKEMRWKWSGQRVCVSSLWGRPSS